MTKKIVVPADIKGMKIRPAQGTIAALVTLLGGTNVQASATEVRDVLEKRVADAVNFPWGSVAAVRHRQGDQISHGRAALHGHVPLVLNKAKYDAMSAEQKKVIDNHCTSEWAARFADPWADFEHAGIAKIKAEPGHEVYEITAEQLAEWKKAAEPLQKKWADAVRESRRRSRHDLEGAEGALVQNNAAY